MIWIRSAINAAVLLYGGVTDFKRREIPNLVPAVLLATGLLERATILLRLIWLGVMILVLIVSSRIAKEAVPGGDVKLLCALTFSTGLTMTLAVMLLTGLAASVAALCKKEPAQRHIPLCTYAAPAYAVCAFFALLLTAL